MTQTAEEFTVDMRHLGDALADDLEVALTDCLAIMRQGVQDNFDARADSESVAWPPRKDPRPQHPLLEQTGALRDAATQHAEEVIEKDQAILAVAHSDTGSIAGRRRHQWGDRAVMGREGILARPYMGMSEDVQDACTERIADEVVKQFEMV